MKIKLLGFTTLLVVVGYSSQAQKVTSSDSVLLFRTDAAVTIDNKDLVKTKGKITQTKVNADGSVSFDVFKQHVGMLQMAEKIKGLSNGMAALPGLAQLQYVQGKGFTVLSDQIFNLNSGLNQTLAYALLDVNASRPKDQVVIISDQNKGTDYNKVLRENPVALGYKSDTWTDYSYDSPDKRSLILLSQPGFYSPFAASSLYKTAGNKNVTTLADKALLPMAANPVYFDATTKMAIAYRASDASLLQLILWEKSSPPYR